MKHIKSFLESSESNYCISLLGAPGSGKGTLAKGLVPIDDFVHISTGDLIRSSNDPELKKVYKAKGALVPDDIIFRILKDEIKKHLDKNIILDGFPRTINQAHQLESLLKEINIDLKTVIYLKLSEETAKERIKKRSESGNRKDDTNNEVIERRFKEFEEQTKPLIDFYKKRGKLCEVDAEGSPIEVLNQSIKSL